MEEQLISFETAKLAKEKGFETHIAYFDCAYKENGEMYTSFEIVKAPSKCKREGYQCVRQSLLQRWLREEHGIYAMVILWKDYAADVNDGYKFRPQVPKLLINSEYNTYEEALERALIKALELIK